MWTDFLEDSKSISAIYKGATPSLNGVSIREVRYHLSRGSVEVTLDLSTYPEMPPKKWINGKFNTVQVVLELWNVKKLSLNELSQDTPADIRVESATEGVLVSSDNWFSCECELIDIKAVSAYMNDPASEP